MNKYKKPATICLLAVTFPVWALPFLLWIAASGVYELYFEDTE